MDDDETREQKHIRRGAYAKLWHLYEILVIRKDVSDRKKMKDDLAAAYSKKTSAAGGSGGYVKVDTKTNDAAEPVYKTAQELEQSSSKHSIAYGVGFRSGRTKGYHEGYDAGKLDACAATDDVIRAARIEGYGEGHADGWAAGSANVVASTEYKRGYDKGKQAGLMLGRNLAKKRKAKPSAE